MKLTYALIFSDEVRSFYSVTSHEKKIPELHLFFNVSGRWRNTGPSHPSCDQSCSSLCTCRSCRDQTCQLPRQKTTLRVGRSEKWRGASTNREYCISFLFALLVPSLSLSGDWWPRANERITRVERPEILDSIKSRRGTSAWNKGGRPSRIPNCSSTSSISTRSPRSESEPWKFLLNRLDREDTHTYGGRRDFISSLCSVKAAAISTRGQISAREPEHSDFHGNFTCALSRPAGKLCEFPKKKRIELILLCAPAHAQAIRH